MNRPMDVHQSDLRVPARVRLAGLWTAAMFLYAYGDLIGFYIPGRIEAVTRGDMGPLGVASPGLLSGIAAVMAIPSLMIVLSLHLPAKANRIANLVLGSAYSLLMGATLFTAPPYYVLLGLIVVGLTGTIAYVAWRSPQTISAPR